jgi:hypothetical protein
MTLTSHLFVSFFDLPGSSDYVIGAIDVMFGIFDLLPQLDTILFMAASLGSEDNVWNNRALGLTKMNATNVRNLFALFYSTHTSDTYFDLKEFGVFFRRRNDSKKFPQIQEADLDFTSIENVVATPNIMNQEVFDVIMYQEEPIAQCLNDPDNVVFVIRGDFKKDAAGNDTTERHETYVSSSRTQLKSLLYTSLPDWVVCLFNRNPGVPPDQHIDPLTLDYNNLFYECNSVLVNSLDFGPNDVNQTEMYFNTRKMGTMGTFMISVKDLLSLLRNDDERIFYMTKTDHELPSVITVYSYCALYPNLSSSAHCQAGQNAFVYSLGIPPPPPPPVPQPPQQPPPQQNNGRRLQRTPRQPPRGFSRLPIG